MQKGWAFVWSSRGAPGGLTLLALALIGIWVIFSRPLDLDTVDKLMEARAYTFYSDRAPLPESIEVPVCAGRVPGHAPTPDEVVAVAGASRPSSQQLIDCGKADLALTRLGSQTGPTWGSARNMIDAIVAQEDRNYWTRRHTSLLDLGAAVLANLVGRGGSTLPMQVIKNLEFREANAVTVDEDGEIKRESGLSKAYRNVYARVHVEELQEHVRKRLTSEANGRAPSSQRLKTAILDLYLQTAYASRTDECAFDKGRLGDTLRNEPDCIDQLGAGRLARLAYGKRLDQLTIAEAATVAVELRGSAPILGRSNRDTRSCDLPPLQGRRNRCAAARLVRIMANDPLEVDFESVWAHVIQRKPMALVPSQRPDGMKDVALITSAQKGEAVEELDSLAFCGRRYNPAEAAAKAHGIAARRIWCDVNQQGAARSAELDRRLAVWLRPIVDPRVTGSDVAVFTTIDPVAQRAAAAALAQAAEQASTGGGVQLPLSVAALVTLDANGEVKAFVVSRGPTTSAGPPGSTIKPFIYATYLNTIHAGSGAPGARAAFEARTWANDCRGVGWPRANAPGDWPGASGRCTPTAPGDWAWLPDNAGGGGNFFGDCNSEGSFPRGSLHEALCRSQNTVAAEVAMTVGRPAIADRLNLLGLPFPDTNWNMAIIGEGESHIAPLDLASAYSVFLNDGERSPWRAVRAVATPRRGAEIWTVPDRAPVFAPAVAGLVGEALSDVVHSRHGTARSAELPSTVAGKTGTVEGDGVGKPRDIWFAGYEDGARREVTVVWLSYQYIAPPPKKGDKRKPVISKETKRAMKQKALQLSGARAAQVYKTYLDARTQEARP